MRRRAAVAVVCLAAALGSPEASAYVRTMTSMGAPMYWNRTVLDLTVYVGDPPEPLTGDDILIALRGAADTWSRDRVGCTSLELRVHTSREATAPVMLDGASRVTFRRESWCKEPRGPEDPCYDPFALAVTSVFARKSDGQIVDADIELNDVTFDWADLVRKPEEGRVLQDLQNTLTHELGHFIGLDHTCFLSTGRPDAVDDRGEPVPGCGFASDEIRATTMFAAVIPGDLERRSLSADDRRAVCDLYRPLDVTLESTVPAGCALAPRPAAPAPGLAPLVLALALALLIARRRRTGPPARDCRPSTDRARRR
jgi:hypothetical protein